MPSSSCSFWDQLLLICCRFVIVSCCKYWLRSVQYPLQHLFSVYPKFNGSSFYFLHSYSYSYPNSYTHPDTHTHTHSYNQFSGSCDLERFILFFVFRKHCL